MPTGATLLIIDPPDTPNEGRYKINYNFSILAFSSFTGISASKFTNVNPTTATVGGIPAGTTFVGDFYLQDMMDLLLYPSVTPNFTSFLITAQSTLLEVGVTVAGSKTFTWGMANTADLQPNSISIEDTTNSTVLASGLANDGTETIFLSSVTKTVPDYNVWTIYGQDTDSNVFSRTYTINWRYAVFYGISASLTLNAAAIVALAGTDLVSDITGSYSLAGTGYGYLCVPNSFSTPNGFRDSTTNLPIEMAGTGEGYSSFDGAFFYDPVSVTRNGIPINYRVYRTKNSITTTTMSVGVTGGTAATLQSVINAGNIASGNAAILGNFSATTYYSGSTPLNTILSSLIGATPTYVQPGTNITTGGTPSLPIVSVVASPSFTSLSATTYYSGTTPLNTILGSLISAGGSTYVQPGSNITTGGTAQAPIISVSGSPTFTAVTAASIFATTLYSGGSLLQNVLTLEAVTNAGNTATTSVFLHGDGSVPTLLRKVVFHDTDPGSPNTSDPAIGVDINLLGVFELMLESPNTIYSITRAPIDAATTYPSVSPSFYFGEDTGTAPPIWMGFLSAATNVNRVYNYLRLSEKDTSNGYGGEVLITATGTSAASYGQYIANFPAKSGTLAMLSDLASGNTTFVQPGSNITTGGTATLPVVNVVDNPFFSAVTAHSVFSTSITGVTYYSGSTPLNTILSNVGTTPNLDQVLAVGNTAENSIILQGDGGAFDLVRRVVFRETNPVYSSSTDAWIGLDYNQAPLAFLLSSPVPFYGISYNAVPDIAFFPVSLSHHFLFSSGMGYAPTVSIGYLSAITASEKSWNYITIGEKDITNNYTNTIFLTATGTTSANQTYYTANFQGKNGTVAYLDDVSGSTPTFVQPGLNITTGGTITRPIVHVTGSPVFTAVTASSVSGTSVSATTFFSGSTNIGLIFSQTNHTHLSSAITDATYGGNYSADANLLLKVNSDGGISLSSSATTPALAASNPDYTALYVSSIDAVSMEATSVNLAAGYFESINDHGIHITSVNGPGALIVTLDAGNTEDILNLRNNSLLGLNVQNDGGLQWTTPTGAGTTRTNLGLSNVFVTPGVNAYTASTVFNTIVGVVGSPVFTAVTASSLSGTSVSATTYFSGSTPLNYLLGQSSTPATYVQPGTNITTGGTANLPIVSVVASPLFTNLTASTLQETTFITPGGVYYRGPNGNLTASSDFAFDEDNVTLLVNGGMSAATYYEGSLTLSQKYAPISVVPTYVQPGVNTTTGGTITRPIVHVAGSPVFTAVTASSVSGTSVSATTFYSGSTPLNTILSSIGTGVSTYVQPGLNITTGGTPTAPIINVAGSPTFTAVTSATITNTGARYEAFTALSVDTNMTDDDNIVMVSVGSGTIIYTESSPASVNRVITLIAATQSDRIDFVPLNRVDDISTSLKIIGPRTATILNIDGAGSWVTIHN